MYKFVLSFVMLALIAFSVNAQDKKFYFGVAIGPIDYDEASLSTSFSSLTGRLGFALLDSLDIEIRLKGAVPLDDTDTKLDFDGMVSGLLKYKWFLPSNQRVNLHAFLGANALQTTEKGYSSKVTAGLSYGLGTELYATDNSGINIEWVQHKNTDFTLNYVGIGYIHWF